MTHRLRRSRLLLISAILVVGAFGGGAAVAADQTFQFDIPAESLGQALTDFSRVSSEQIVFSEDAVSGKKSGGLHGRYSASDALNTLLVGSDLRVEVGASGVMMVRSKNAQAASNEAQRSNNESIETVTVTGSHIRDVEALTPVKTLTSIDLNKQGYTTLSDALQQLPENSKAGASSESNTISGVGDGAVNNYGFASGINLRGLGSNDTLVLLNGRRLPSTALGSTTDISGIPLSAIDRVEILDDGASAIYGSDAVAGVVNIITKTSFDGVETGAHISNISDGKQPDFGGNVLAGFAWGTGSISPILTMKIKSPCLEQIVLLRVRRQTPPTFFRNRIRRAITHP